MLFCIYIHVYICITNVYILSYYNYYYISMYSGIPNITDIFIICEFMCNTI